MVSDLEPDVRNARNAKLIRTRGQLLRTPRTGSDSNFSEPWGEVLRGWGRTSEKALEGGSI